MGSDRTFARDDVCQIVVSGSTDCYGRFLWVSHSGPLFRPHSTARTARKKLGISCMALLLLLESYQRGEPRKFHHTGNKAVLKRVVAL